MKKYDFSDFDSKSKYDFSDFDDSEQISQLESALRGAGQGLSFGFSDEATGLIESLLTDKSYEQARDESRANYAAAQEANPITYGTGEVGGALATALIPGVGALNAGKAASFAGRAGLAAAQGGLTGAGLSNEEDFSGLAKDAAFGAATGAAMQGIGEKVIAPAMSKAGQFISNQASKITKGDDLTTFGLKKIGNTIANVSDDVTDRYLKNPEAVNNSSGMGRLAEDLLQGSPSVNHGEGSYLTGMPDSSGESLLTQMYKKAGDLSSDAWDTLSPKSNVLSKNDVIQAIDDLQQGLSTNGVIVGQNQQRAFQTLEGLKNQLGKFGSDFDETLVKRVIQNLDENIDWNDPSKKLTNDSIKGVRTFLDQRLKDVNPNYRRAMESVEEVSKGLDVVQKTFQNRQDKQSFDKFIKAVKNLERKPEYSNVRKALDSIKQHTGFDLESAILDSQAKTEFLKDTTNGSRKTILGTVLGGVAGKTTGFVGGEDLGKAVGAVVGSASDKFAGRTVKALLDGKITADKAMPILAPKLGKFAKPLMEAAKRGNKAMAATHFLLMQRNPEYRKLINEEKGEKE